MPLLRLRFSNNPIEKLSTCTQLRDQVQIFDVLVNFYETNYVGMMNLLENSYLPLQHINLPHLGLPYGLDGIPFTSLTIHALSNNAVMTMSNLTRVDMILNSDVRQGIGDDLIGVHSGRSGLLGLARSERDRRCFHGRRQWLRLFFGLVVPHGRVISSTSVIFCFRILVLQWHSVQTLLVVLLFCLWTASTLSRLRGSFLSLS
mmetsp:Transcript_21860/g.40779  ORF Transcript_21860/g.40779 Transcript_21860/m.40779 type:complete len:203 (-) Transcript_21860:65-673(-)